MIPSSNHIIPDTHINTMVSLASQTKAEDNPKFFNAAIEHLELYPLPPEQKNKIVTILQDIAIHNSQALFSMKERIVAVLNENNAEKTELGLPIADIQKSTISLSRRLSVAANNPLSNLPKEILFNILLHLGIEDISTCRLSCKNLYLTTESPSLWKQLANRDFLSHSPALSLSQSHYDICKNFYTIRSNFIKGFYTTSCISTDHALEAANGKFFTTSKAEKGTKINVWDVKTMQQQHSLILKEDYYVSGLLFTDNMLFSRQKCSIKMWDLETGKCSRIFDSPQNGDLILSCTVNDGKVFAGYLSGRIEIWDLETGVHLNTLIGHTSGIGCLVTADGMLYASSGSQITEWDIETAACTGFFLGHTEFIGSLKIVNGNLVSSSGDCTLKVWDLKTRACLNTSGNTSGGSRLISVQNQLASADYYGNIDIWDLGKQKPILSIPGSGRVTHSVAFDNGKLFFECGVDKLIRIWDFNVGRNEVFKQIASMFRSGSSDAVAKAMSRFNRMPDRAKNQVYEALYHILKPFTNDYFGCAEHAFHNQWGLSSTPDQKAQAIENCAETVLKK